MAAPHVTGSWALLKQSRPTASVTDVLAALRDTGAPVVDYRNGQTVPRVNVDSAIDLLNATATPTASSTPTSTPTDTLTPTATAIPTDTSTATITPLPSPTAAESHTPSPTGAATPTLVPTASSTPGATTSPTPLPTSTAIETTTATPQASATVAPTYTAISTGTPSPTLAGLASLVFLPSIHEPESTPTPTNTSVPTGTPIPTPTDSPTVAPEPTASPTSTGTVPTFESPDDPYFASQWGLSRIGAAYAWPSSKGQGLIIAIVDSGADYDHPDLQGKLLPGLGLRRRRFIRPGRQRTRDSHVRHRGRLDLERDRRCWRRMGCADPAGEGLFRRRIVSRFRCCRGDRLGRQ